MGPTLGYLITKVLPVAEPYVIVVFLASLAPCAPFLQQMVGKARGDMGFAGALIPLVAVGTVVLMPLMAPLLIKGVSISTWSLAKPLLLTILLPLMIGAAIRHYAATGGSQDVPGSQGGRPNLHLVDDCGAWRSTDGGCSTRRGNLPYYPMTVFMVGMGTYHLSLRLRHETESAKRHGAGDGHAERRSGVRGGAGHSERGIRASGRWSSCGLCGRLCSPRLEPKYSPTKPASSFWRVLYEYLSERVRPASPLSSDSGLGFPIQQQNIR